MVDCCADVEKEVLQEVATAFASSVLPAAGTTCSTGSCLQGVQHSLVQTSTTHAYTHDEVDDASTLSILHGNSFVLYNR